MLDGNPVGYISLCRIPKPDERIGCLYVDELWVAKPYRGRGIGSALLKQAKEFAGQLGLWRVRLTVGADNDSARRLYQKAGFTEDAAFFCELEV